MAAASTFSRQVAIVTGGGRGIGLAVAERLGKDGATIALFDVAEASLKNAVKQLTNAGITARYWVVDVTQEAQVTSAVSEVQEVFGSVHVLVQAAGITGKTGIQTESVQSSNFDLVLAINLRGIFLCCKAVLPGMVRQKYGRIVNIASIAGKEGNAGMLAYSTSKAGVIGLTKVIGKEYAESGVTCNAVAPAVIRTAMVAAMPAAQVEYMTSKIPMRRTGELREIADLVAFIASPAASFTTAFCFDATGGRATY